MATLKESLQSKVDTLGIGTIKHLHSYLSTSSLSSEDNASSAQVILKEPKIYKSIFCLDNLGIDKSIKSVVIEVKDSILRLYYLLDSSCLLFDFECNYQTLEILKELPTELIHYLRILCSKKGTLELIIKEDTLLLLFEDTFPSKMPMKERKEKEVDKYVLSTSLNEVDELDREVISFVSEVVELEVDSHIMKDNISLPIELNTITRDKEPIDYWGYIVSTSQGDFTVVYTSGIKSTLVICPTLASKSFVSKATNMELEYEVPDIDCSSNIEEDIQDLDDTADLVDSFILGEIDE
jgi:hypothetical protein